MHANVDVEAWNDETCRGVSGAIKEVQENRNDNALLLAYKGLNHYLRADDCRDASIRIDYRGQRISFRMEARPYFMGEEFKNVYYNSNEGYTKATMDDIAAISGIKSYIGISGGLTQVITQLSALKLKNNIRKATLCDRNGFQLLYNALQLARYDAMPKSINPMWHIKAVDNIEARNAFSNYVEEGKLEMDFVLQHDTIDKVIGVARRGTHFIYSSNAFGVEVAYGSDGLARNRNTWEMKSSGDRLIGALESSGNVKPGSAYMAASVNSPAAVILRKDKPDCGSQMPLYSYCSGDKDHSDCVHMG
jgi:hypothetical protein